MAEQPTSFGRLANQETTTAGFLALEERLGHCERFSELDALVGSLLTRSLRGEHIVAFDRSRDGSSVFLLVLNAAQRRFVDDHFTLARQQANGAWVLPESAMLEACWANLPCYVADSPRFAAGFAADQRGTVDLHSSADAFFVWAVLGPLFTHLYRPFALRGPLLGQKDRAWQIAAWREVETWYEAVELDVSDAVVPLRYGGGWSTLDAQGQMAARQQVLASLATLVSSRQASCSRAIEVKALIARYYQKMKRDPPALRQVLTKDLQRVLAGYFDGDWLAFLDYVGGTPHPDERIVIALPEPQLVTSDRARITAVAAAQGLPVEEVERALRAFWGITQETSPVDARVTALRGAWQEFDRIHARQVPGMAPLWGLVEEGTGIFGSPPYQPGLYRRLLSPALVHDIDQLWATSMLPRWPGQIVSSISPHALMAEAFGPALRFWHGCALTAWFICEGPSSRTDLAGIAQYFRKELATLEELGCPVDPTTFTELIQAEERLGPIEPMTEPSMHELRSGVTITSSVSHGSRRAGFEILRDIVTRHRRSWASTYLDAYLRARWETEVRDAARDFGLLLERRGRPPTAKQFAPHAAPAANHWFGGDIRGLYGMIGEPSPIHPARVAVMPTDREAFVQSVLARLIHDLWTAQPPAGHRFSPESQKCDRIQWDLERLAELSLDIVQQEEARGRLLTLSEFGRERFVNRVTEITADTEWAWACYLQAIDDAKRPHETPQEREPTQPASTEPLTKPASMPEKRVWSNPFMIVPFSRSRDRGGNESWIGPEQHILQFWLQGI